MEMKLMVMNTWIPTCWNVNTSIYSQELENCDAWLIEICIHLYFTMKMSNIECIAVEVPLEYCDVV